MQFRWMLPWRSRGRARDVHPRCHAGTYSVRTRLSVEALEDRFLPSGSALTYSEWAQLPITLNDGFNPAALTQGVTAQAMEGTQLIGLNQVDANYPYRGQGYSVAVIDTGIDYTNPAFGSRVITGWNFVNNTSNYTDDEGHGTAVAGIIGSADATYPGIAPGVNLIALKVLDSTGSGTFGNVANALNWVVAHQQQYNIVAVNMSLGAGDYTSNPYAFLDNSFQALINEGVFISVASGNDFSVNSSQQGLAFPAVSPYVASVGAVWDGSYGRMAWQDGAVDYSTTADQITSFTERGPGLDLLAPGAMVTNVAKGGGYVTMAGTSMATPFVTGAAALLHQELDATGHHSLANEQGILSILQSTGVPIVDSSTNANVTPTGLTFKRINLAAAVASLSGTAPAPVLSPIPDQSMSYGQTSLTVNLSASDSNSGPLTFSGQVTGATNVSLTFADNQLTIQPPAGYSGTFTVQVTVSDGTGLALQVFNVTVAGNAPPTLGTIAGQTLSGTQPVIITLAGSDADGDALTYSAQVVGASQAQAYALKQQLGFGPTTNYDLNWWGQNEKWLLGAGQWYFILPNGQLREWNASTSAGCTLIATLPTSFYVDPSTLWNAQPLTLPGVSVAVSGNQLTIQRTGPTSGVCQVMAMVSDGQTTATQTFQVTVLPDNPPVLATVPAQTIRGAKPLTVTLAGSDPDGDSLTYSAVVVGAQAYQLRQSLGLVPVSNYYLNWWGANEKWLRGSSGIWYILLPTGQLRQWNATTLAACTVIATLDPSYYADPSQLWNAQPTPGVSLSSSGNQLTIQLTTRFSGTFQVQAAVSDGVLSATQTFQVTVVANQPPVLAAVPAQTIVGTQPLTITLSGSDPDGDPLTYSAQVAGAQASQVQQQLGLVPTTNDCFNWLGASDKWIRSSSGQWYFILPDGTLHKWLGGTNVAAAPVVASLGASYYADPSKLWSIQSASLPNAALTISGNQLTIQAPAGYSGTFQVQATVSDGVASASQTFQVTITAGDTPPVLNAIANQSMSAGQTLAVNLSGSDADGDALTYPAQVISSGASVAYQLRQQLGLTYTGNYYTNAWGAQEKWLLGQNNQWYFILPDGEFRKWAGTMSASMTAANLVATFDGSVYADPSLLWNAQPSVAPPTLQVIGNQLQIQATAAGTFQIQVTVSDGHGIASQTFTLTVA